MGLVTPPSNNDQRVRRPGDGLGGANGSERRSVRRLHIDGASVALSVIAIIVTLIVGEAVARFFVKPSTSSFGILAGIELPPTRLLRESRAPQLLDPNQEIKVSSGVSLTREDLWGRFRLDPVIGYTYQEGSVSAHGWWQSNNIGARSHVDTLSSVPPGRSRLPVFGESFAQGSRLPQESVWTSVLQQQFPQVEIINLAVDGYSMAQAALRFADMREQLRYNTVLVMFVPEADLARDINTLRQLFDRNWDMPMMPRFELREGSLQLVPTLYPDPLDLYRQNQPHPSRELVRYLREHDRLYSPSLYEEPGWAGRPVLSRLGTRAVWNWQKDSFEHDLMSPEGEALQVSRAIFLRMLQQASIDNASLVVGVLPIDYGWWNGATTGGRSLERWNRMIAFLCAPPLHCMDLLPDLMDRPAAEMDRAYDGWHFGPSANHAIAAAVARGLFKQEE